MSNTISTQPKGVLHLCLCPDLISFVVDALLTLQHAAYVTPWALQPFLNYATYATHATQDLALRTLRS